VCLGLVISSEEGSCSGSLLFLLCLW
jgi:hypothetical protein